MSKLIELIANIWKEVDTVIELFAYLGIAWLISKIFSITFTQSLVVVFVYFLMNIIRIILKR